MKLNGTGFTQTALDFPLYLHTHQSDQALQGEDASGGNSGVVLSGTYRLQVGGLTILDTEDGRPDDGEETRSTRRITSTGTLRISALHEELSGPGVITDYGKTAPPGMYRTPEVYIDGNEAQGQARFRVGNAVFHDGYMGSFADVVMDGVHVEELETLTGVTLIAVGSDRGDAPGAPQDVDDEPDRPQNIHSGMIVVRSEREVRIDEASRLRVGDPNDSVVVDGRAQAIMGDDGSQSLLLQAALGIELGNSTDGRALYRDRPLREEFPELGTGGHPAMLLRDIELDGCSLPSNGSDAVNAYTAGVYAKRTQCVSRIGILPQPTGEQAADWEGVLGRYSPGDDESEGEAKELFVTSDNYVDFDGRSRVRIGGLFIDGLGQQEDDRENAFSEFRDRSEGADWSFLDGDLKNTIRGDSGVALDGGRQGGDVNITAGTSRDEGLAGGAVNILSGGEGSSSFEGDSGAATFGSASVQGNSGSVSVSSGGAADGRSGDVVVASGDAAGLNTTGSLTLRTGSSSEGLAGGISLTVGSSAATGEVEEGAPAPTGGSVSVSAGYAQNGEGGSVDVRGGSSDALNGGDVSLAAGAANGVASTYGDGSLQTATRGGDIDLIAGGSSETYGGSIKLLSGVSNASAEVDPALGDDWITGGGISIETSRVAAAHSGPVSIATGDSDTKVAGSIDIAAGSGALNGANVTLRVTTRAKHGLTGQMSPSSLELARASRGAPLPSEVSFLSPQAPLSDCLATVEMHQFLVGKPGITAATFSCKVGVPLYRLPKTHTGAVFS